MKKGLIFIAGIAFGLATAPLLRLAAHAVLSMIIPS